MQSHTQEPELAVERSCRQDAPNALDKAEIARLSTETVSQLTVGEMLRVIEASEAPFLYERPAENGRELQMAPLEQLVYLARRHCRKIEEMAE